MKRIQKYVISNVDLLITILLSIVLYLFIFTPKSLFPSNINLMMSGSDLTQNYLGGAIYRAEPLSFDVFGMHSLQYPNVSSALQTDSNPLVSFVFKLLKPFGFKPEFQFFGIWTLFNFIISGIVSVLIFRHIFNKENGLFSKHKEFYNKFLIIASSVFFVLSPVIINRSFAHVNLTAHWIILLSILIYLNDKLTPKVWLLIGFLIFISIGIHPYFLGMIFPVILSLIIKKFRKKEIDLKDIFLGGGFLCIIVIFCFFCFHLGSGSDGRSGYGFYKANLNAFINPYNGESLFIKKMANFSFGEAEGANYLGLGLIILIGCICVYAIKHKEYLSEHKEIAFACLFFTIFALSCNIHLGDLTILEYKVPRRLFAAFRSSGRFLWPVWYLLVYYAIYLSTKKYKSKVKYIIPILLIVQLVDLLPLFKDKRDWINKYSKIEYSNQLKSQEWSVIFKEYQHVVFPVFKYYENAKIGKLYNDFWFQSIFYNTTINTGYITLEYKKNKVQTKNALNQIEKGKIPVLGYKAIYILPYDLYDEIQQVSQGNFTVKDFMSNIKEIDGIKYILCN